MFPLFEVVRLLSVKDDADHTGKSPSVYRYAYKEAGEVNLLALSCTNCYLLLRYSNSGKDPTVQQLPWPQDKPISAMCFDPTVSWLLVVTDDTTLLIIPARSIMDSSAKVDQLWRVDDITVTKVKKSKGVPSAVLWWNTLDGQQIAIIGTKSAEIVFVDLINRKIVHETSVEARIMHFDLMEDDQQMTTHLLITGQYGDQWKLLLESRTLEIVNIDPEMTDIGYEQIDGRHLPSVSIITVTDDTKANFLPLRFHQFSRSVTLSPQYARGHHFIAAHDNKSSTYQIYDSNIEHSPLFVYKLPLGAHNNVLSNKLIYTTTKLAGDRKLLILANQRAEMSMDDQKDFNKDSILQQFDLPKDERLITVMKKSYPFYWHDKKEEDLRQKMQQNSQQGITTDPSQSELAKSFDIQVIGHTVLNGCIIITDAGVYECRPRISPERLFLDLAIQLTDPNVTESLGISLGLDLNTLYEQAANHSLQKGNYGHAVKLFKLAKCTYMKQISSFARHGHVPEVMNYLKPALQAQNSDVNSAQKKQLSNIALYCYIYQLHTNKDDPTLQKIFLDFLISNFFYDEHQALVLLAENGFVHILLELAKARGLVLDALKLLANYGHFTLESDMIMGLLSKGFTNHLVQAASGSLLHFLSPAALTELLCSKPELGLQNYALLQPVIMSLTEEDLEKLAAVFDPSRPPLLHVITHQLSSRGRASSINSLNSVSSEGEMTPMESNMPEISKLIDFFVSILLHLNMRRGQSGQAPSIQELLTINTREVKKTIPETKPVVRKRCLPCRPSPIGAGHQHVAMVRNGDLYTWGRSSNGRLGHGDLALENTISPPCRVETLHMLQVKVMSVSCGGEHTMALTHQGLYGWGSSKYGQVGLGTRHIYSRPMLVDSLSSTPCVQVDCGQYHTLALTHEAEVYSWGWGVHGQLGQGGIEDCLVPSKLLSLSDKQIAKICGGYCHSLALSSQGDVWGFGCGFFGQIGLGDNHKQSFPVKISTLKEKILLIATKFFHNVAVSASNRVYTWGCHPYNLRFVAHAARKARQGGKFLGDPVERFLYPEIVETCYVNGKIVEAICGSSHCLLITLDGDVYAWGRNVEGQIGNNSRQEVRLPNMITAINDRQMKHLASGGEFNVALDSDGLAWVWGKNDTGQLGMDKMHVESSSKSSVRKRAGSSFTEVLVPTVCPGLPAAKPASALRHSSLHRSDSYDSSDGEMWYQGDRQNDRQLDTLPELHTLGEVTYCRIVLLEVLEHFSDFLNRVHVLRRCADLDDWLSAVYVCINQMEYPQAMTFHLRALRKYRHHFEEKFGAIVSAVVNQYLQLCVKQELSAAQKEENYRIMVLEVLQFWEMEGLPAASLERVVQPYLDHLSCGLSSFLFWENKSQENTTNEDASSTATLGISQQFRETFSTGFLLQILQDVIEKILSSDFEKKHPVYACALRNLTGVNSDGRLLDLQPSEKLLPFDRLWKDIIQNLQKASETREHIYINRSEVDHLEEKLHDQGSLGHNENQDCNTVLFTCGHHYTLKTFMDDVLVKFNRELSQGTASLPDTATLLMKYYNRKGLVPLACPKCVLNALHSTS